MKFPLFGNSIGVSHPTLLPIFNHCEQFGVSFQIFFNFFTCTLIYITDFFFFFLDRLIWDYSIQVVLQLAFLMLECVGRLFRSVHVQLSHCSLPFSVVLQECAVMCLAIATIGSHFTLFLIANVINNREHLK